MAHKWFTIIVISFLAVTIFTVILCVIIKFLILKPSTVSDTSGTTIVVAATTNTLEYPACLNISCITIGQLVINLTWSRSGDADLVVVTPTKKVISRINKGPDANTDRGQYPFDVITTTGPEYVFWSKNFIPPSGTYLICAEPYAFSPTVSYSYPVTFTVQIQQRSVFLLSRTETIYQLSNTNASVCNSYTSTYITSFYYS